MNKRYVLAIYLAAALRLSAQAQTDTNGQFGPPQIISTQTEIAEGVYAADLDGDGDQDVLSASRGDNKIAWYKNDGKGDFGEQQIISQQAVSAQDVYATDLDGDGDQDVLSASGFGETVAWYENDGEGNFSEEQIIAQADYFQDVYAADLDGDGDQDVLSASDNKIAWYENDGQGNFGEQQVITTQVDGAREVYAADLDGDGDLDALSASFFDGSVDWYENDGQGNFGEQRNLGLAEGPSGVYAADLDGDGDQDVLSCSYIEGAVVWYENDGEGNFERDQYITLQAVGAENVYAADLDRDGDLDVVLASSNYQFYSQGNITWYENKGKGKFGEQQFIVQTTSAQAVYTADLDGDGDQDVLSAVRSNVEWYENSIDQVSPVVSSFTLVNNNTDADLRRLENGDAISLNELGSETFTVRANVSSGGRSVRRVEFRLDPLVGDAIVRSEYSKPYSLFSDDKGDYFGRKAEAGIYQLTATPYYLNSAGEEVAGTGNTIRFTFKGESSKGGFGPQQRINAGDRSNNITTADLDGDGDQDVVTDLTWYKNDGTGRFQEQVVGDGRIFSVDDSSVADLDGDGDQDVVVASEIISNAGVDWFENDGQGNFGPQQSIAEGSFGVVLTTDLDGDGNTDVVTQEDDGEIRWYENSGDGNFGPEQVIATTSYTYRPSLVEVSDLDGDGDQDVLSFVAATYSLVWYENDGEGSFASPQLISNRFIGSSSLIVYATDLDGDGDQDLLANYNENVAWLENDGQGNFSDPQVIETAFRTEALYAADLDGDGDQDVVSGSLREIAWYENDGQGNFGSQQVITTQVDQPVAIYAADLDGDRAPDVMSVTRFADGFTWYKNLLRTFDAPVVTNLTLFDTRGNLNQEVKTLEEGDVIDLRNSDNYQYGIRAEVFNAGRKLRRVVFELMAPAGQSITRSEYATPYSLFGDSQGKIRGREAYAGIYQLTATPYYLNSAGEEVAGTSNMVSFVFLGEALPSVNSFTLVNNNTDEDIQLLEDGDRISLEDLNSTTFTVRAEVLPGQQRIRRVEFRLDAPVGQQGALRSEYAAPYSLFSDDDGDYFGREAYAGEYKLTATPYYLNSAGEEMAGTSETISFTFTGSQNSLAASAGIAYPVPFNETLTLKLGAVDMSQTQIQLVHGYGKIYQVSASQMSQDEQGLVLNLAQLPSGPYTVRVMNLGQVQTFRVSKE